MIYAIQQVNLTKLGFQVFDPGKDPFLVLCSLGFIVYGQSTELVPPFCPGGIVRIPLRGGKTNQPGTSFLKDFSQYSHTVQEILGIPFLVPQTEQSNGFPFQIHVHQIGNEFVPVIGKFPVEPGGCAADKVVELEKTFRCDCLDVDHFHLCGTFESIFNPFCDLGGLAGIETVKYPYLFHSNEFKLNKSILQEVPRGFDDFPDIGKDGSFQDAVEANRGKGGSDPSHRTVKVFECPVGDLSGDFRTET
jgi:hypothetical protein